MRLAFLLLLLTIFTNIGKSQDLALPAPELSRLSCIYKLTYQPDSTSKVIQTEYMSLLLGNKISQFQSRGSQLIDSLVSADKNVPFNSESAQLFTDKMVALPRTRFRYSIYKIPATNQLYCYDRIGPTLYQYEEPSNLFKWNITSTAATIAGYSCQRATTNFAGRVFEAWFTREVPVAEGPYKFYGLPGLIVKVNDSRNFYTFELVKLIKTTIPVSIALPPAKAATRTTKAALVKGQKADELAIPDRLAAMGNNISEAQKQASRERAKRRNNPLELK